MILAAPLPAAPPANKLTTKFKKISPSSSTTKITQFSSLNSSFSVTAFSLRRGWGRFCTEKESAHDLFDVGAALVLQMTEIAGVIALLHYTAKPQYKFSNFIIEMWSSEKGKWLKTSALGIVFLIGFVLFTSAVADRLVGPKDVNNPILKEILLYSPASRTACLFLYCLVSPMLEELVYRGFLLRSLCSEMKWWQAVVISSCIFSIAHFSSENFVQLVLIGAVLGTAYCWTGSLAAPFTIHSVYNATILLATIMSADIAGNLEN